MTLLTGGLVVLVVAVASYLLGLGAGKAVAESDRRLARASRPMRYEIVVAETPSPQFAAEPYRWEVRDADAEGEQDPFVVGRATTRAEADVRALAAVAMIRRQQPSSTVVP